MGNLSVAVSGRRTCKQTICQRRRLKNRLKQQKAAAGVLILRKSEECLTEIGIASKSLCAADQPEVELVFEVMDIRQQLGIVALGIVDEIARVNLEELRKKQARRVGEMRPRAALDLRKIGLADRRSILAAAGLRFVGFLDGADQLLLGQGPVEAPKIAFDLAKIIGFCRSVSYCRSR